jgi:amino acid transporter
MNALLNRSFAAVTLVAGACVCLMAVVLVYTEMGRNGNPANDAVVDWAWAFYDWLYDTLRTR